MCRLPQFFRLLNLVVRRGCFPPLPRSLTHPKGGGVMTYRAFSLPIRQRGLLPISGLIVLFCIVMSPRAFGQNAQPQSTLANGTSTQVFALLDNGVSIEYPPGWSPNRYANVNELLNVPP